MEVKTEKYTGGNMNKSTIILENTPSIISFAAVGSTKEKEGPLGDFFDYIDKDGYFGEKTWEGGESAMQKKTAQFVLDKAHVKQEDIDVVFAGDLLNQCISSTYGLKEFEMPFLGVYGACSTMAESLLLASLFVQGGFAKKAMAVTSSHFCTAERQFRFPLEYGCQRTPTSQWTATACGGVLVGQSCCPPYVRGVTMGTIQDLGITDTNNMGAAMAPAAAHTIHSFLKSTGKTPEDFDCIFTGDLGQVGSDLLVELLEKDKIKINKKHKDCGLILYDRFEQEVDAGGSGCGCSASVLATHILPKVASGELKNVLFVATGALMSTVAIQQGGTIPGIAHLLWISHHNK